jgi:GH18 family chitinase
MQKKFVFVFIFFAAFIMYTTSAAAADWQTQIVDSTGDVGMDNSIVLDGKNNPHISYSDETNNSLKYAHWNGRSWHIQTLDNTVMVGRYTSIALDSIDHPHISYWDYTNDDLKYAYLHFSNSWHIQTVDSADGVGDYTSIALDSSDSPHISYHDETNCDLKYAYWDGSSWQIQTVDSTGWTDFTSIALDSSDNPHISYHDYDTGDLKYAYWDGSSWHIQTVDIGNSTSLALDSSDNPHISYVASGSLKYAYRDGSNWHIQTVDNSSNVGFYTSIALDSIDHPHISYSATNGSFNVLKYTYYSGDNWYIQTVDNDTWVGYYSNIAIDSGNNTHISYYDGDAFREDLKYAVRFLGGDKRILAYYPDWVAEYKADKIPYRQLSHICHAFMIPDMDGNVSGPTDEPALITNAQYHNVKVLVALGGASVDGSVFSTLMADPTARQRLVNNLYNFCTTNDYDGVDLDWENPGPESEDDKENLKDFVQELRQKFDTSLEISIAVIGKHWSGQYYNYNELNEYVNFYNLMTYDMHCNESNRSGHNSPIYTGNDPEPKEGLSCEAYMDYMIVKRGIPSGKINMGIPFYGHEFTSVENLFDSCIGGCPATPRAYKDIIPLIGNGWTYNWDAASLVPYLTYDSGLGIISYDNASSISEKVDYALKTRNAGGVFTWEITQDYTGGNQPLMDAMYNAVLPPKAMPWLLLLLGEDTADQTFLDHFDDEIYTDKWSVLHNDGTITESGTELHVQVAEPASGCDSARLECNTTFSGQTMIVEARVKPDGYGGTYLCLKKDNSNLVRFGFNTDDVEYVEFGVYEDGVYDYQHIESSTPYLGTYNTIKIIKTGNQYEAYLNGVKKGTAISSPAIGGTDLVFELRNDTCQWKSGDSDNYFDWLSVDASH